MSDKEDLEREWYGTLPDAERADVLKALIAERGQTRRAEIEAQRQTDSDRQKTDGFHVVRGLIVAAIVITMANTGTVTCHAIDAFVPQAPLKPSPVPTTTASAVPSTSASADAK